MTGGFIFAEDVMMMVDGEKSNVASSSCLCIQDVKVLSLFRWTLKGQYIPKIKNLGILLFPVMLFIRLNCELLFRDFLPFLKQLVVIDGTMLVVLKVQKNMHLKNSPTLSLS